MSVILPPPPPREQEEYFIEEDSKECGLTKAEYEFLLDDIEFQISEANRKYGFGEPGYLDKYGDYHFGPKPRSKIIFATAVPVKKTKIQQEDEELKCLNFLRSKMRAADPRLKERFTNLVEGVKYEDE